MVITVRGVPFSFLSIFQFGAVGPPLILRILMKKEDKEEDEEEFWVYILPWFDDDTASSKKTKISHLVPNVPQNGLTCSKISSNAGLLSGTSVQHCFISWIHSKGALS